MSPEHPQQCSLLHDRQTSMLRKSASYHSSDLSLIKTATVHSAAGCLAISWATVGLRRNLYLIVRPPSLRLPSQRLTGISLCWRQHQKASVTHVSIGIPEHGGVPSYTTDLICVPPPHPLGTAPFVHIQVLGSSACQQL